MTVRHRPLTYCINAVDNWHGHVLLIIPAQYDVDKFDSRQENMDPADHSTNNQLHIIINCNKLLSCHSDNVIHLGGRIVCSVLRA